MALLRRRSGLRLLASIALTLSALGTALPQPGTPTAHAAGTVITSVLIGGSASSPTVTVNGSGFGAQPSPSGAQPTSCPGGAGFQGSDYATGQYLFTDTTVPWAAGQTDPTGGSNPNCIGIIFSSYSSTQVVYSFGTPAYTEFGWVLNQGDSFTLHVNGASCAATVDYNVQVACAALPAPPAPSLTLAEAHPNDQTTIKGQLSGAAPNATYTLSYDAVPAAAGCAAQPGTTIGTDTVSTDGTGSAVFTSTVSTASDTSGELIAATATGSSGQVSPLSACVTATPGNDDWVHATSLWSAAGSNSVTIDSSIDITGQERWYDFPVQPGAQVHVQLNAPQGSVLTLHRDLQKLYNLLSNPNSASSLVGDLAIADAPSGYLPSGYLPSGYLPSGYLPSGYLPSGYLPSGYLPSGYLPSGYLPSGYLPSGYLPSGYLPSGYLPSGYLPSGYLPSGYLPSGYLPSGYLQGPYASAPRSGLMAIASDPTASSLSIDRNTWDLSENLYVRVAGPPGQFTLTVTESGGVCGNVAPIPATTTNTVTPTISVNGQSPQTLILWDSTRIAGSPSDIATLHTKMAAFAQRPDVNGQVVDVSTFPRVVAADAQADANTDCPTAQNITAGEIKAVVQAYRTAYQANGTTTLKYIVLVGDNHSIPFFAYPDEAGLAPENGYVPPVADSSATQASLRDNYVLSQDEYGSTTSIPRGDHTMPIPDLAVGRLVTTAADASNMLDAYTATGGVITPTSALVTGYDFVADAAVSATAEISAGINPASCGATCVTPDQLITPQGAPQASAWTADDLRQQLYTKRHDLVFMAGHFSAGNLLAADYTTQLSASEVVSSAANLTDTLILALGCHGGLNIPGTDAIAGVSPSPDWPQAMAEKGATLLASTGYAYGDTVLTEYGERLFVDVARQMRTGSGNVPIGVAEVAAKQDYLNSHFDLGGIDEKTLLETTLYGLPMLQVDMQGQRLPSATSSSIVGSAAAVTTGPGAGLGLSVGETAGGSPDIAVAPTTTLLTTTLTDQNGQNPVTASWLSGADGVVAHPLDPVFPLQLYNATVPSQTLRGILFLGGTYDDSTGVTPLTVAPATETSVGHPAFFSNVLYPTQVWSANYFDTVDGLNGGLTTLAVAPAQYVSSSPGSTSGTLRQFTDLHFKLYYLGNSRLQDPTADGGVALDPAPNILGATASNDGSGNVTFSVRVQNVPLPSSTAPDVQDVYVTYADPADAAHQWLSVQLAQDSSDPTLWTGTASGLGNGTLYMIQAANATGLVSLATNNGAYYTIAPASPIATVSPTIVLQPAASSSAYQSSQSFTVALQAPDGTGIANQPVAIQLGTEEVAGTTGSDGTVALQVPLVQPPGAYTLSASYGGGMDSGRTTLYNPAASTPATFTITKAATTLALAPAAAATTYGQSAAVTATLQSGQTPLPQKPVFFTISGPGTTLYRSSITDANGQAALGALPLPAGSYTVSAAFGSQITAADGSTTSYADLDYASSTASASSYTVSPAPQTITFGALPNHLLGDPAFTASATGGGSGNPVTFSAGPSSVCTSGGTNGATITVVGIGTCMVTANQAGNGNYLAAPSVAQSFTVSYPPLYLTLAVTSSPPGPVITTGSVVTATFTLGNHTGAPKIVNVKTTLTYVGNRGTLSLTVLLPLRLNAGQTLSKSVSFTISRFFPRGAYTLGVTAKDGSGDTASSSAALTVS